MVKRFCVSRHYVIGVLLIALVASFQRSAGFTINDLEEAFKSALFSQQASQISQQLAHSELESSASGSLHYASLLNDLSPHASIRIGSTNSIDDASMDYGSLFTSATRFLVKTGRVNASQVGDLDELSFTGTLLPKKIQEKCQSENEIPLCKRSFYRTIDGSCNNLLNPHWGMANACQFRLMDPVYEDGVSLPRRYMKNGDELPNPRFISERFLEILGEEPIDPTHTTMVQGFGQFLDHDMVMTPMETVGKEGKRPKCCPFNSLPQCFPIYIRPKDRFYGKIHNENCMNFVRSKTCPTCALGYREQRNAVTAFIDLSHMYGLNDTESISLRMMDGTGRMLIQPPDVLPPSRKPHEDGCSDLVRQRYCFHTGDIRINQQVGIVAQSTTWLRQHNYVAVRLKKRHPHWSDDEVYFEARRILGAQMQMVVYNEFLPKIIGPEYMKQYGLTDTGATKYNPDIDPGIINEWSTAAFRFGHAIVSNSFWAIDLMGHIERIIPLRDAFNRVLNFYEKFENDKIMLGFSVQPGKKIGPHFVTGVTHDLRRALNKTFGEDLPAINIQRGRDHGIGPYVDYVKLCSDQVIETWDDLANLWRPKYIAALRDLYYSPKDVDLFVGGLCEHPVEGGMVGPTFSCIIGNQFHNVRYGDRFFFTHYGEDGSFTPAQLRTLRESTLYAKIICQTSKGIKNIHEDVFLQISPSNPVKPCSSYPELDLSPWD